MNNTKNVYDYSFDDSEYDRAEAERDREYDRQDAEEARRLKRAAEMVTARARRIADEWVQGPRRVEILDGPHAGRVLRLDGWADLGSTLTVSFHPSEDKAERTHI